MKQKIEIIKRSKYGKYVFLCFLFIILSFVNPLFASTANHEKNKTNILTDLSLEELVDVEIVVAASKHEQKIKQAPSSVTIITSNDIKKYGYRTLADVLKSIRGFYVTYDRNYHYAGIRGFSTPGDYGTHLLIMINGHRINDQIYHQASIGTEFPLDIDLIDRVEIVRGPSSSLYGSNALFGIVNIITRKGNSFNGVELSANASSHDTYTTRLTYGSSTQEGKSIVASGTLYDSKGQTLYYDEFNDPLTNNGFTNIDGDEFQNFFMSIEGKGLIMQMLFSQREKEVPTAPWNSIFGIPGNVTTDKRNYIDIVFPRRFDNGIEVSPRVFFDQYYYYGNYPIEGDASNDVVINKDYSKAEWWGAEITASKQFTDRHRLSLGAEYVDCFRIYQKNYDTEVYFKDSRDFVYWALYAQDEIRLFENVNLNAGIRYDNYESFGDSTNPRFGLIYDINPDTTVKLLYGRAFRAPNPYELYYEDGTGFQKANPNLEPETIKTYEVVLEKSLPNDYFITVSLFHFCLDDLIIFSEDPADSIKALQNIDSAESNGVEFEIEKKWRNGSKVKAGYSYQKTENRKTNEELVNSPEHLAKLNFLYPLISETLFTGLELQYTGERKTLSGDFSDDFVVTNLTLFTGKLNGDWEMSASVYNLFNVKYFDVGSEEHRQDMIEQDGRSFRLKITRRF